MRRARDVKPGKVWLVGAGPGDPELLTVRALRLLGSADVVAYDELVSPEILACVPDDTERIPVGRRANGVRHHDEEIHPLVVARALAGKVVVRLKAGDPFVFGRGGEEACALAAAGIPFEIVPGITAAIGAAATNAIPLTHRGVAATLTFVTAHRADGLADALATVPRGGTLAIYMGASRLAEIAEVLVANGWSPETPIAAIASATTPRERTVRGTLATITEIAEIASRTDTHALGAPAVLLVGAAIGVTPSVRSAATAEMLSDPPEP